jgi:hypothetical protein
MIGRKEEQRQYFPPLENVSALAGGEIFPLQHSVSVRDRAEVIITHTKRIPCIVETPIASLTFDSADR